MLLLDLYYAGFWDCMDGVLGWKESLFAYVPKWLAPNKASFKNE
jgi:hypothetical protein